MNFWVFLYRFSWVLVAVLAVILGISLFLPQIRQYQEVQRTKAALERHGVTR